MDFTVLTVEALKSLSGLAGSYGWAIILLTVLIRIVLWPLNTSQQKSMRQMQKLQPRLKEIQDRYKSNPQVMQQKMMEFYKEHKFNPMGGCMPLLIQMPVFILLYSALMSGQFNAIAGHSSFFFIDRLDATLKGYSGGLKDGKFGVEATDKFNASKEVKVYLKDGQIKDVKIEDPKKSVEVQGDITPGQPMDLKISLDKVDMKFSELDKAQKVVIPITNIRTREVEEISFERKGDLFASSIPTIKAKTTFHKDVLVLIVMFGLTMFLSQKLMMAANKTQNMDPMQEAMQKNMATIMPFMIVISFVIVPIPAGVLLYMIASNILQVVQTVIVNKKLDNEERTGNTTIVDANIKNAKTVPVKEISNENN